jgi:hypothetical protein
MNRINQFPFNLNEASAEEKKRYFLDRTINHPNLNKAFYDVMEKVNESPKGKVFLVFGPTGVGKSTLCKRVKSEIILKHNKISKDSKGDIPVVMLELPSPDNGKFNWRDFYKRLLKEMKEPLIDNKISNVKLNKHIPNHWPSTAPELRESLENAIIYRKTKIILLDEAQHLLKVASPKSIQDQMDTLKSIANLTGSLFFMFGTFDLMSFFDLNGQLGRRTSEVYFPRYNVLIPKEKKEFLSVINTFRNQLPFCKDTNLLECWEFLYERSIGCVGILKDWLDECVKEAINKNMDSISFELIEKHAPTPTKALKIAEETIDGEQKVKEQGEKIYTLRETLGLNDKTKKPIGKEKGSKKSKDVGKRNPTRDEIGITESGA